MSHESADGPTHATPVPAWDGAWREPISFISPSRYVQGPGVLRRLPEYVARYGSKAVVVTSSGTWSRLGAEVSRDSDGVTFTPFVFSGESTAADIDNGLRAVEEAGADVVVGLGGGKVADSAKAIGHRAGTPWIIAPTLASTDAPCSSLSVVYDENGELLEYLFLERSPDLVLVDSAVIAMAPPRLLAAGMADAVSTRFESAAAAASGTLNCSGGRPSAAALALGKIAWDVVSDHGVSALRAVAAHAVTEAVELVIEVNTLHSGLGFESGGFSGAHAIHNGLTMVRSTDGANHGEKVNFGVLTQMVLERRPDRELDEFIAISRRLGLPVTLSNLGVGPGGLSEEELQRVAERTCIEGEGIHQLPMPVTSGMVASAIQGADAYARGYLAEASPGGSLPA
ncbi:MAG TPA: glycerol dehydrogenase [Solirubrobacterales bacterium]